MQYFGFAGPDAVERARAEIKSRLLGSASFRAPRKPVPQEAGDQGADIPPGGNSPVDPNAEAGDDEGKLPVPDDERAEIMGAAAGDEAAAEGRSDDVKWIEPVFDEAASADGATQEHRQTHAVIDDTERPHSVPTPEADGPSAEVARLEEAQAPSAAPRSARFRWGRRSPASPELRPSAANHAKKIAAEREALVDEVAALHRTLAAEREAAAARIAGLEAALGAEAPAASGESGAAPHKAAAAATDEIAALRLTLMADLAAAAEEIATLRKTLTAEREAAADEIAMLRTILAAQQEAAVARTTRIKAVLEAMTFAPAASG
jgi:hypothetical protein